MSTNENPRDLNNGSSQWSRPEILRFLERAKVPAGAASVAGVLLDEVEEYWNHLDCTIGNGSAPLVAAIVAAGCIVHSQPSTLDALARIVSAHARAAMVPLAPLAWCLFRIIDYSYFIVDSIDDYMSLLDLLPKVMTQLGVRPTDLLAIGPDPPVAIIQDRQASQARPADKKLNPLDQALQLCEVIEPAGWAFIRAIPTKIPAPDNKSWFKHHWVIRAGRWLILTTGGRRHRLSPKATREVRAWIDALACIPNRSTLDRFRREGIIRRVRGFPVLTAFGRLVLREVNGTI